MSHIWHFRKGVCLTWLILGSICARNAVLHRAKSNKEFNVQFNMYIFQFTEQCFSYRCYFDNQTEAFVYKMSEKTKASLPSTNKDRTTIVQCPSVWGLPQRLLQLTHGTLGRVSGHLSRYTKSSVIYCILGSVKAACTYIHLVECINLSINESPKCVLKTLMS